MTVTNPNNPNGPQAPGDFWLYNLAVLWPAVVDPLEAIFYVLTLDVWLTYLQHHSRLHLMLALALNILALLTKEVGTTLVVTIFLVDRLLVAQPAKFDVLVRRYAPFALIALAYAPVALLVQHQSVFTQYVGYGLGLHILSNLEHYFESIVLPWGFGSWSTRVWLAITFVLIMYAVIVRRNRSVLFALLGTTLTVLPVALFPFVVLRYLYLPLMFFSAAFAIAVKTAQCRLRLFGWYTLVPSSVVALLTLGNGLGIVDQISEHSQLITQSQRSIEPILAQNPAFPDATLLFFVDPPMLSMDLSGWFLLKYGTGISIGGTDIGKPANLHSHPQSYFYFFDEQGQGHMQSVGTLDHPVITQPELPAQFSAPVRLEKYELASTTIKHGDTLLLVLYWRVSQRIDKNYAVFVHLVDATGQLIDGFDGEPQQGRAPTSSWRPGEYAVSSALIPISARIPPGDNYRLEVGMYFQPTMERLHVIDADGKAMDDKIILNPLKIVER